MRLSKRDFNAIAKKAAARKERRKDNAKFKGAMAKALGIIPSKNWDRVRVTEKLWEITSILVRRRDARILGGLCLICHIRPIECAYHLVPAHEGSWAKWALEAMVGGCHSCNWAENKWRLRYGRKHRAIFGDELIDGLIEKAAQTVQYSTADLQAMYESRRIMVQTGIYE